MKYYIIAGEASGDLHGSNLMKAIFEIDQQAEIRFWGGDLMQKVGGTLVKHYKELAFMGFVEVIFNLKTILKNIKIAKVDILNFNPDALIFIDYPGFNLRIAKWAKQNNFKTHYYISPQIWAWKENRINAIKRDIDKMYVILPFEKDFYEKKHHFPVNFVGHPLIDAIANFPKKESDIFRKENQLSSKPIIAILPGSRKQEISKMLAIFTSVAADFPNYQFVIAGAPSQDYDFYKKIIANTTVQFVANKTYELLQNSEAALVTSGTATLETALFKVPEVVCYKGNWISYQIAKRLITLKYISLVNLIMDAEIVTELIQDNCNKSQIIAELTKILEPKNRKIIIDNYTILEQKLGNIGASEKTAKAIIFG
jgi:lipid-A-disaccharide synthase